ncbi:MAG TPA: AraC family transcriptional regulator [Candidatus Limiplasma sp.]|nr:AraC family transcriptional regulator [Candidatus Limiplasma sp.]HPS81427.1 AraC family transcriptional regulator [Candidatus Limiplasma sp.]
MKIKEKGVLSTSEVYFHTASETAKNLFFYIRCTGYYQCDCHYAINRQSYDSFLLLYVVSGSGYVMMEGRRVPVTEGMLVLLDCYQPHAYGTDTEWSILWAHFDGVLARRYYEQIAQNRNLCATLPDPYRTMRALEKIFRMYHHDRRASEALVSQYLITALTSLLVNNNERENDSVSADMDEVLTYITQNLDKPLTLADLARRAALSQFYFSRVFKRETGYTPHEYLVNARVNAAKFYLKTTAHPNKEIAYRCGFSSESSFCTVFKRLSGLTPQAYRNDGSV